MHNEELPRGFQDADLETRDFEEKADALRRARKAGFCDHGFTSAIATGQRKCNHCGKVGTEQELEDDLEEILSQFG